MLRLICPVVIAFLATPSNADTISVCLDGSCDYTDIQDAINAAADGDVIEIAAGTHLPGETIDTVGKAITLRGSVGKAGIPTTIIDGRGAIGVFRCVGGEGVDTVFEHLLITGGQSDLGGGMYCLDSSPQLVNCMFEQNTSSIFGGGMYCLESDPTLARCVFRGNSASINGGGIYCFDSTPAMIDCRLEQNSSGLFGGGAYNSATSNLNLVGTIVCGNAPDQISGPFADAGENCIREICSDCKPSDCPADLSGNAVVDGEDLGLLFVQWGVCTADCTADLTGNGEVDGQDLGLLISAWGSCP